MRAQEQHAAIAGAVAVADGSVDVVVDAVDIVDNPVVPGSAARWGHLLSKNVRSAWPGSVWPVQLPAGHGLRWRCHLDKKEHNCSAG